MHIPRFSRAARLGLVAAAVALGSAQAGANQLIANGGFEADAMETYTPAAWSVAEDGQMGGVLATATNVSYATGTATPGAASGGFYGLVEAFAPSANALIQSFAAPQVTSAVLSFNLFVANPYGTAVDPAGLDYTVDGDNQHVRVDLLATQAGSFETGATVLRSFDVAGAGSTWGSYSFDVTDILAAGGSYQLRFANVANRGELQLGVDNVSLEVTPVPEPETYALFLAGLGLLGAITRRRRA